MKEQKQKQKQEQEFKEKCQKNNLKGKIKTMEFFEDYGGDILDYLTEMTEAFVMKPFRPADIKFLQDCGFKENIIAFMHWVDESTYKEYITYIK